MPNPCKHELFCASVSVNRLNREDGGPIVAYTADVRVSCHQCGQPFEFFGLPVGYSAYRPAVSLDGQELRVPLVVPGTVPPEGLPGYSVRLTHPGEEPVKQ